MLTPMRGYKSHFGEATGQESAPTYVSARACGSRQRVGDLREKVP